MPEGTQLARGPARNQRLWAVLELPRRGQGVSLASSMLRGCRRLGLRWGWGQEQVYKRPPLALLQLPGTCFSKKHRVVSNLKKHCFWRTWS